MADERTAAKRDAEQVEAMLKHTRPVGSAAQDRGRISRFFCRLRIHPYDAVEHRGLMARAFRCRACGRTWFE